MCRKLIYLVSFMILLGVTSSVHAALEPFSLLPIHDAHVGNDAQIGPDQTGGGTGMHARDVPERRRVAFAVYDISELKGGPKSSFSNVRFSNYGHDVGVMDVYGIIEEQDDNIDETTITWNTAPGVKNDPAPPVGDPVVLDFNDLTALLMTFTAPEEGVREPTEPNQALTDFVNSDMDGIVAFLFAPGEPNANGIVRTKEKTEGDGGTLLEGYYIPVPQAIKPNPGDGQTEVPRDVVLSWRPGVNADKHDVYFGTDLNDVNDANRANPLDVLVNQNQDANTYKPDGLLELDQTYYWRIDEVNDVHPNSPWRGYLWSFSTPNYLIVDDFEDYNDYQPNRIFDTWIDGWGISENGSQVGYESPPFAEQTIVNGGSQSLPFFYNNTGGIAYSEAVRSFDAPLSDWTREGVNKLTLFFRGYPMAFVEDPTGTYTMSADGVDVWDESDEFRYAYKVLSGNGSITARVVSIENTDGFAKAGVMIRETLDPFSRHGFMFITPEGRRAFQNRPNSARESYSAHSKAGAVSLPCWVRLERQGIFITAYYSEDGINWIQQPDDENTADDASDNPRIIVMRQDTYVGLAVCSHNANAVCTAVFSDVTTTGNLTDDDWQVEAIGVEMPVNDAQPLYVTLEGGGTVKVVEHPDNPNAVLEDNWQQWDVPLTVFSDAGVDLTSVDKMTIGVGSQTDPQGGEGSLFFDDIRLYLPSPLEPNTPAEE